MKLFPVTAFGLLSALALVGTAGAHHSFAMFDNTRSMVLDGTMKSVQLTNPHSYFILTAAGSDGVVKDWNIEGPSPNNLIRRGWKHNDLNVGDHVSITFHPRKDGAAGGELVKVKLPDGKELESGAGQRPSTLPPVAPAPPQT